MATTYLQVEGKTGRIFQYSKTAKEGFDEYTSTTGTVGYRKYYNTGLYGVLQNVGTKESKIGEQIMLTVKRNGEYFTLQLPLYSQGGSVDNRYAESLIRFLPNLKKGEGYRFYPYAIEQEGTTYLNYGVSVIKSPNPDAEEKGEKVEPYLTYSKEPSKETDIPNLEWVKKGTKNRPSGASQDAKDEFLLKYLAQAVDGHLAYEKNASSSNTTTEKTNTTSDKKEAPVVEGDDDEYDDLPF